MSRNGTVSAPGSVSGSPKHKHGKLSKGDIRVVPVSSPILYVYTHSTTFKGNLFNVNFHSLEVVSR